MIEEFYAEESGVPNRTYMINMVTMITRRVARMIVSMTTRARARFVPE